MLFWSNLLQLLRVPSGCLFTAIFPNWFGATSADFVVTDWRGRSWQQWGKLLDRVTAKTPEDTATNNTKHDEIDH